MNRIGALIGALFLGLHAITAPAHAEPGRLLVVGGGLGLDSEAIYAALIDNRPENMPNIAIISAAATDSAARATTFAGELMFYGVSPENIIIVQLAVVDDPDTPDIDESDWVANGASPEEVAKIENAGAIWFTGGDQARLSRALIRPGGIDSPMLAAIRERLRNGAIVGGISAGAAAMSSPMILRGDSFDALFGPVANRESDDQTRGEPLVQAIGLRFLSPFLVDQHVAERARLGRLARAIMEQPQAARLGIGIDEDTALLIDLAARDALVLGTGTVTLLDGRDAVQSGDPNSVQLENIALSRLYAGDRLDLNQLEVTPEPSRTIVAERQSIFGGLWPSVEMVRPMEGERRPMHIIEQRRGQTARFEALLTGSKRQVRFIFEADRNTRYWRSDSDKGWNGTLTGVRLSLTSEALMP